MTSTATLAPELVEAVTAYLRTFGDKAGSTDRAQSVTFDYSLSYDDTAGVTPAVRDLAREGYHVVFYAERFKGRTVVVFHPRTHTPERALYGYRSGRKVLAAFWQ